MRQRVNLFTRYYMDFVMTVSLSIPFANSSTRGNSLKKVKAIAAVVMFGNIFICRIVDVWNNLSDAVVKSTSAVSFKNSLGTVDLSRFLTVV